MKVNNEDPKAATSRSRRRTPRSCARSKPRAPRPAQEHRQRFHTPEPPHRDTPGIEEALYEKNPRILICRGDVNEMFSLEPARGKLAGRRVFGRWPEPIFRQYHRLGVGLPSRLTTRLPCRPPQAPAGRLSRLAWRT